MNSTTVAFVGGGNMARSLVGGLRARGGEIAIRVAEPDAQAREAIARQFDVATFEDNALAIVGADVVVLAVKPQVMRNVCTALAKVTRAPGTLWISIAAGVRMAQLDAWLGGGQAIVRSMPNTPALIGAGITGMVANARVALSQRTAAASVLEAAGATVWIDREELMDAVTAVSGSGPAYFLLLMESLEKAAIRHGLPAATARALVLHTALGAARMAVASDESPAELRHRVTSPGGTTAAALAAFEAGAFGEIVDTAIDAATRRGSELANAMAD